MTERQTIKMAGRPYTFVDQPEPDMAGHDNDTVGHLLNSRGEFAGYVTVMDSGARILLGGPKVSRDAERVALAQIELEVRLETIEDVQREAVAGSVVVIHAPDRTWRLKIRRVEGREESLISGPAIGAYVSFVGDGETESYVHLKPGSTGVIRKGRV